MVIAATPPRSTARIAASSTRPVLSGCPCVDTLTCGSTAPRWTRTAPRLVGAEEAFGALPAEVPRPPKLLRITEFLRIDLAHA
jgi:hypothetical protein